VDDSPGVRVEPEVEDGVRVLPPRLAPALAVTSAVAAITLVVLGIVFAGESVGAAVDLGIRADLRALGSPWHQIALVIDWTGEPVGAAVVLATLIIVFLRNGNRRAAALAVVGPAASVVVTSGMKPLVGRTINDGFLSYPSGHTASATAFTLVVLLASGAGLWLTAVLTVAAAVAMAWAQVLLNAHYPTDTLGGFCAAVAVVPLVAYVIDRLADRRTPTP
jgi:membrane-associated phospholipid phosphatase